jgi:hypothetical protein
VIGFSRGAAQARDFANQVLVQYKAGDYGKVCLEFRFMGLFDTVAQFGMGLNDGDFNMTIAPEWKYVAQAYALNEHRPLFPLQSIRGSSGGTRIELGFIGAHADIGGGYYDTQEKYKGDLSDVALMWMVEQAQKAGVKFTYIDDEFRQVSTPVVHDQRNNGGAPWPIIVTNPNQLNFGYRYDRTFTTPPSDAQDATERVVPADDREVRFPQGGTTQEQSQFGLTDPTYGPLLEGLIVRAPNWEHRTDTFGYTDNCVGAVDMQKYRAWLEQHYGLKMNPSQTEGSSVVCQPM